MIRAACCLTLLLLGTACSNDESTYFFPADAYPEKLSDWKLFEQSENRLSLASDTYPYQLLTPLFSDYALKLRTIRLPAGASAQYAEEEIFDFPAGTVISKTFYYPKSGTGDQLLLHQSTQPDFGFDGTGLSLSDVQVIETRLLVRQPDGWDALPYVWNSAQNEATLQITGALQRQTLIMAANDSAERRIDFVYAVPNRNECKNCHAVDQNEGHIQPIGPAARNLDRTLDYELLQHASQLAHWQEQGWLAGLPLTGSAVTPLLHEPGDEEISLNAQARNYLDINCGHCHQPGGSADTSGLFLHAAETSLSRLGVCKPPVAAGRGTGGHRYSISPGLPQESILSFRLQSRELDVQMPELGRSLVHEEGVALINAWISQMQGDCAQDI